MAGRVGASASWVAASAVGAAGAATVVATVLEVWRLHVALPYWDEWQTIDHFRWFEAGTYGVADLARQHNEHRLLFPRLVFFADEFLCGLSGRLDLAITFALQAVSAAALIALMLRLVAKPHHRAFLAGLVLLLLFTLRQEQNFSNGFQVQFVGVFTAGLLAAVAYAAALDRLAAGRRGGGPLFVAAGLACGVATYTMANGVLTGFVLVAAALLARAPARVTLLTLAGAGLLATLFFWGYRFGGDSLPPGEWAARAWAFPRFITAYLGNPLGSDIRATQAFGLLGLALAGGAAWRVGRDRTRDPASLALVTVLAFVVATACATAYGRIRLGTQQAFESRYATPSLLFWAALAILWFPSAARAARRSTAAGAAFGILVGLLVASSCWFEIAAWPDLAARSATIRRVSDSLLSGLYDADEAASYENTAPETVVRSSLFLREHRLAIFAGPAGTALDRPIAAQGGPARPTACGGSVEARADPRLGPGGVRLSGRAQIGEAAARRMLVADSAGVVVGFGSASLPGEASERWSGYAKGRSGEVLHAYARLQGGSVCEIGAARVGTPPPG